MADTTRNEGRPIHKGALEPYALHRLEASAPSRSLGTSKDRSFRTRRVLERTAPFFPAASML
eukprot:12948221-Alexandrium_andersonii.AAC.1